MVDWTGEEVPLRCERIGLEARAPCPHASRAMQLRARPSLRLAWEGVVMARKALP